MIESPVAAETDDSRRACGLSSSLLATIPQGDPFPSSVASCPGKRGWGVGGKGRGYRRTKFYMNFFGRSGWQRLPQPLTEESALISGSSAAIPSTRTLGRPRCQVVMPKHFSFCVFFTENDQHGIFTPFADRGARIFGLTFGELAAPIHTTVRSGQILESKTKPSRILRPAFLNAASVSSAESGTVAA